MPEIAISRVQLWLGTKLIGGYHPAVDVSLLLETIGTPSGVNFNDPVGMINKVFLSM